MEQWLALLFHRKKVPGLNLCLGFPMSNVSLICDFKLVMDMRSSAYDIENTMVNNFNLKHSEWSARLEGSFIKAQKHYIKLMEGNITCC